MPYYIAYRTYRKLKIKQLSEAGYYDEYKICDTKLEAELWLSKWREDKETYSAGWGNIVDSTEAHHAESSG